ncbi:MAG: TolC family protein [Acidobacteriota bacterium]|nr:TolC family protein [Acidobacteriota bacterium]
MRVCLASVVVVLIAASSAAGQQPKPSAPAGVTMAELERLAIESNPTLRAAQARIDAARGRAKQAGSWPNPVIGGSAEEVPLGAIDPRGAYGVFVEQPILLGGKLRLNRAVFDRTVERSEAELERQRQRIVSTVRRVFFQSLTVDRRIEVQERLAALASEAVAITAQLFNVGAADRPDFLESEIEAKRVQLDLNAAKNRSVALRQQLAAVVGNAEVAARRLSGLLEEALPEIVRATAVKTLLEQSPQIQAARAEIARTQAITAAERRATFPDLFLRGGAAKNRELGEISRRPIGWEASIEAGISVPLFNRNAGGVAAARAEELRAQAELQRLEWSLQSRLASEFATYLTALGDSETYRREILPRAEEAYRLYLARYREMAAAYPQVLIAQRNLFELWTRYLESLEDGWQAALRIQGFLSGDGLQSPGGADEMEDGMGMSVAGGRGGRQ